MTPRKRARIRLTAERYLAWKGAHFADNFDEMRFDVVGILLGAGRPEVRHVEDAF